MKIVQFKDGRYAIRRLGIVSGWWDWYEYLDLEVLGCNEYGGNEIWWPRSSRYFMDCTTKDISTIKLALIKLENIRILKKAKCKAEKDYGVPVKL